MSRILDKNEAGTFDTKKTTETKGDIALEGAMPGSKMEDFLDKSVAKYWKWQVHRMATATKPAPNDTPSISSEIPQSDMGLFARLPGELRNRVYRLALVVEEGPFTITGQRNQCSLGPCTHAKLPTAVPGVLSTCKQVRYEALPIFLAENTLKFDARTVRNRCTGNFLQSIGPYGQLVRHVDLEIMIWGGGHRPGSLVQSEVPHEITIKCPTADTPRFVLTIDVMFKWKRQKEVDALVELLDELNERAAKGVERKEALLLEFVWSDVLVDLVWACEKNR